MSADGVGSSKWGLSPLDQPVKTRRYDASSRRAAARQRRDDILSAARELMLRNGYAATTVGAIARAAGVSTETVYKAFGDKPGVVQALFRRGLEGSGDEPAEERSNRASWRLHRPRARRWLGGAGQGGRTPGGTPGDPAAGRRRYRPESTIRPGGDGIRRG